MRAGLVAVSENVVDAELAESWVGPSDPHGAIGHRFSAGTFTTVELSVQSLERGRIVRENISSRGCVSSRAHV